MLADGGLAPGQRVKMLPRKSSTAVSVIKARVVRALARPAVMIFHFHQSWWVVGLLGASKIASVFQAARAAMRSAIQVRTSDATKAILFSPSGTARGKRPSRRYRFNIDRDKDVRRAASFKESSWWLSFIIPPCARKIRSLLDSDREWSDLEVSSRYARRRLVALRPVHRRFEAENTAVTCRVDIDNSTNKVSTFFLKSQANLANFQCVKLFLLCATVRHSKPPSRPRADASSLVHHHAHKLAQPHHPQHGPKPSRPARADDRTPPLPSP